MIAAKLRHKDLVSSVLRSTRFDGSDDIDFLAELVHSRNASGQTLLAMVALQGKNSKSVRRFFCYRPIFIYREIIQNFNIFTTLVIGQ